MGLLDDLRNAMGALRDSVQSTYIDLQDRYANIVQPQQEVQRMAQRAVVEQMQAARPVQRIAYPQVRGYEPDRPVQYHFRTAERIEKEAGEEEGIIKQPPKPPPEPPPKGEAKGYFARIDYNENKKPLHIEMLAVSYPEREDLWNSLIQEWVSAQYSVDIAGMLVTGSEPSNELIGYVIEPEPPKKPRAPLLMDFLIGRGFFEG